MQQNPKDLLEKYGFQAKKSWGQNFLTNPLMVFQIAETLRATPGSTVIELGPGTGVLTQHLVKVGCELHAIEKDREMLTILEQEFPFPHFHLIDGNAARYPFSELSENTNLLVIGNLPYQLSSPILFHILENKNRIQRAVFLLQKEVVDRLIATPTSGKNYSTLSARFLPFFHCRKVFSVPKNCFFPVPKVDSAVVLLERKEIPEVEEELEAMYAKVIKLSFAQKRKTILNNLSFGIAETSKEEIVKALQSMQIDPIRRAETLKVSEFRAIALWLRDQKNIELDSYSSDTIED